MRFLSAALLAWAGAAYAQPADKAQLDTVEVRKTGVASVAAYGPINSLLDGLQRHGEGLFRFEFRIKDARPGAQEAVTLALQHADFFRALPVAADGLVELPVLPAEQARETDIVANRAKGTLQLQGTIELTTPPAELTLAGVRHLLEVANRLRRELLPWYARMLFPAMNGVRVCSAEPGWEMRWRDEKAQLWGVTLPAVADERDPSPKARGRARACTVLTGQEHWPESARLLPTPDTTLSIRLL